jgi:hypothetical protein
MSDPLPAPDFGRIGFTVSPMNIGEGYAQGIESAGKSIASAISSVSDIAKQNIDANDTLSAMRAGNILPQDAYESVMGKSLGAKQQMLGLYAGQYIANQAAERAQALQMGKSTADIHTEHAKLLDTINAVKSGYGMAVGVPPGKQIAGGAPVRTQPPVAPAIQPAQPAVTSSISGAPSPWAQSGTTGTPPPPPPPQLKTIGPPMGVKDVIPPGASLRQIKGPKGDIIDGVLMPNGIFRPRPLR